MNKKIHESLHHSCGPIHIDFDLILTKIKYQIYCFLKAKQKSANLKLFVRIYSRYQIITSVIDLNTSELSKTSDPGSIMSMRKTIELFMQKIIRNRHNGPVERRSKSNLAFATVFMQKA